MGAGEVAAVRLPGARIHAVAGSVSCLLGAMVAIDRHRGPRGGRHFLGSHRPETTNAPCGAFVSLPAERAYQKNCRRASRMFGLSLTKLRALALYFLLSTIT